VLSHPPCSCGTAYRRGSNLTTPIGKQGRSSQPHDEPSTKVSPVNADATHRNYAPPPAQNHYANSDPNLGDNHGHHHAMDATHYSVAAGADGQNRGAQAGGVAAHAAGQNQKASTSKHKKIEQEELARIVAEENESKGKLPNYPGLERWKLLEKMGDGAFSNVYRARDLDGLAGEVAIKVVRKFEMNSSQVSLKPPFHLLPLQSHKPTPYGRAMPTYTRISRSLKVSRCAHPLFWLLFRSRSDQVALSQVISRMHS